MDLRPRACSSFAFSTDARACANVCRWSGAAERHRRGAPVSVSACARPEQHAVGLLVRWVRGDREPPTAPVRGGGPVDADPARWPSRPNARNVRGEGDAAKRRTAKATRAKRPHDAKTDPRRWKKKYELVAKDTLPEPAQRGDHDGGWRVADSPPWVGRPAGRPAPPAKLDSAV